ncbi:hypothetical protein HMPREF1547_01171 [Blautia sp. KLE 1732]|nr:hypothetical protein HMPREF1547_01171 [Blautia sp. KLE 1732]
MINSSYELNGDLNRSFVKETSTCFILYLIPNKNSRAIYKKEH